MDRAERTGLGVAVIAHAALFAALSLNLLKPPALPKIENDPIEVSIVDQVALQSSAPNPAPAAAPAPAPAETAPTLPEELAPAPLPPVAQPKSTPKPVAQPLPTPVTKPAPAKPVQTRAQPQRKPGLSRDLVSGLSDAPSNVTANGTPAKVIGAAVASSIGAEIRRQLKPYWKPPTGADAEMLRTTISVHLNRDGSILGSPQLVRQTGVNESNRGQAKLHVDQAIKAVRLAAPFKLPAEYYDAWQEIQPNFDARLAQ